MNREITRWRALLWLPVALASTCVAAQTTTAPPAGRLLASNCFQCHGYDGKSRIGFERLSGESSNEIYKELREMRAKSKPDIMDMHARGYTDAQMRLIADYLATQKSTSSTTAADVKTSKKSEKKESKS
ncbi:MAG: cytochrome c class I [Betaproteobacteria bacterium HGW-Betaproteobacteria-7]|jgi:cytochrome c553|nr:MAG: cytochrome c class I [Betaproteobacteria bacterium HGW-Betaproteobacteria-7]